MKTLLAAILALLVAPLSARAETPLRIAVVSRTIFYLPAWTAERQGFFKAAGIEPTIEVYDGAVRILADLRAGSHQIAIRCLREWRITLVRAKPVFWLGCGRPTGGPLAGTASGLRQWASPNSNSTVAAETRVTLNAQEVRFYVH